VLEPSWSMLDSQELELVNCLCQLRWVRYWPNREGVLVSSNNSYKYEKNISCSNWAAHAWGQAGPGKSYNTWLNISVFFIFFIITIIEYVIFLRIIVLSITCTDMCVYFNYRFMNPVGQIKGPQFLIPRPKLGPAPWTGQGQTTMSTSKSNKVPSAVGSCTVRGLGEVISRRSFPHIVQCVEATARTCDLSVHRMQALPLAPGRPFSKSNKVKGLIG